MNRHKSVTAERRRGNKRNVQAMGGRKIEADMTSGQDGTDKTRSWWTCSAREGAKEDGITATGP
jgi:hypothetical protein